MIIPPWDPGSVSPQKKQSTSINQSVFLVLHSCLERGRCGDVLGQQSPKKWYGSGRPKNLPCFAPKGDPSFVGVSWDSKISRVSGDLVGILGYP